MSEKAPKRTSPEDFSAEGYQPTPEHVDHGKESSKKIEHKEHVPSVKEISKTIEKHSDSSAKVEEKISAAQPEEKSTRDVNVSPTLKNHARKQGLKRVQKKLGPVSKSFSKFTHQPAVEAISDAMSSTVARPSGLFVGGLFSLIASVGLLFISRYYGYEYNFFVGLAGLAGGFVTGLLIESFSKIFKKDS